MRIPLIHKIYGFQNKHNVTFKKSGKFKMYHRRELSPSPVVNANIYLVRGGGVGLIFVGGAFDMPHELASLNRRLEKSLNSVAFSTA